MTLHKHTLDVLAKNYLIIWILQMCQGVEIQIPPRILDAIAENGWVTKTKCQNGCCTVVQITAKGSEVAQANKFTFSGYENYEDFQKHLAEEVSKVNKPDHFGTPPCRN